LLFLSGVSEVVCELQPLVWQLTLFINIGICVEIISVNMVLKCQTSTGWKC